MKKQYRIDKAISILRENMAQMSGRQKLGVIQIAGQVAGGEAITGILGETYMSIVYPIYEPAKRGNPNYDGIVEGYKHSVKAIRNRGVPDERGTRRGSIFVKGIDKGEVDFVDVVDIADNYEILHHLCVPGDVWRDISRLQKNGSYHLNVALEPNWDIISEYEFPLIF